jgi:hypothetical protein
VLGAIGTGKTVSQTWIACRLIEAGHGTIMVDPKGDQMLCEQLKTVARPVHGVDAGGPLAYNPYAHGSEGEIADKALAGENFTEPYQRQAKSYLAHAVRVMHQTGVLVTPVTLLAHMVPPSSR